MKASKKNNHELIEHISKSVNRINSFLYKLLDKHPKKAELISYWLNDYVRMVDFEDRFIPRLYGRYKRGAIIKVNLGFNIGSEQGGLHYAVVIEKNNPQSSPVITVAPLTSINPNSDTSKGNRYGELNLGTEIYGKLIKKCNTKLDYYQERIYELSKLKDDELEQKIKPILKDKSEIEKTLSELRKMKPISVCHINQITTISKIRIYDPKNKNDVLHGIRISDEMLDLVDEQIKKYFLK